MALNNSAIDIAEYLVQNGANINIPDNVLL